MAARRDHDANIGWRSFHLFRLPAYMENQLVELMRTEPTFAGTDMPNTPEQVIEILESLSPQETTPTGTGPRLVGSIKDISKPTAISRLASLYAHAARKGERIYPYFAAGNGA